MTNYRFITNNDHMLFVITKIFNIETGTFGDAPAHIRVPSPSYN